MFGGGGVYLMILCGCWYGCDLVSSHVGVLGFWCVWGLFQYGGLGFGLVRLCVFWKE